MSSVDQGSAPPAAPSIATATARDFKQYVADYTEWAKTQPLPPALGLKDGWTVFTPEMSQTFLHRTVTSQSNRRVSFNAVVYYAQQMLDQDWQKTGQAMIFDETGKELDGQHRAWASLLTSCSFPTYVVASVPPNKDLFAYIDNSKIRNAADALETAGMDGQSRLLSQVVRFARHYDAGVMTPKSKGRVAKPSPMEVVRYVVSHEGLREAINLMLSEYANATELMLRQHVAGFIGYKILESYGEDVLDEFMRAFATTDPDGPNTVGDPLVAIRKKLQSYSEKDNGAVPAGGKRKLTPAVEILAHIIKAFNAWHVHQAMRTVIVRVDEDFPKFDDAAEAEEAA
jgi:hypothetical protein